MLYEMRCFEAKIPENPDCFSKFVKSMHHRAGGANSRKVDLSASFFSQNTLSKVLECLNLQKVAYLDLAQNPLRDTGIKILAEEFLNQSDAIVSLNLASTGITHTGMSYLTKELKNNISLVELKINNLSGRQTAAYFRNQITQRACVPLAEYLRKFSCPLEFLDVSHNDIQDEGVFDLLEAITSHKPSRLTQLDLTHNNIRLESTEL